VLQKLCGWSVRRGAIIGSTTIGQCMRVMSAADVSACRCSQEGCGRHDGAAVGGEGFKLLDGEVVGPAVESVVPSPK
jgi:hypothetical protein